MWEAPVQISTNNRVPERLTNLAAATKFAVPSGTRRAREPLFNGRDESVGTTVVVGYILSCSLARDFLCPSLNVSNSKRGTLKVRCDNRLPSFLPLELDLGPQTTPVYTCVHLQS